MCSVMDRELLVWDQCIFSSLIEKLPKQWGHFTVGEAKGEAKVVKVMFTFYYIHKNPKW